MKPSPYSIDPFTYANGTVCHRLSGMQTTLKDGVEVRRQIRKNFRTMAEAVAEQQRLDAEFHNLPEAAPPVRTYLSPASVREAERAFAELSGKPLMDAVRFYLENYSD